MSVLNKIISFLTALAVMIFPSLGETPETPEYTEDDPQYVVFMVTNVHYFNLEPYVKQMVELHGEIDPDSKRMYAFGVVGPMCLTQSIEQMNEEVNHVFMLAEKYNVPVYFQMDDCTNYSTDFGDGATTADGGKFYNDPEMCEWVAFPEEGEEWGGQSNGMLPRWHCGWSGVPFATAGGFPCFNSEKYLSWYSNQVTKGFIEPLLENYSRLKTQGKDYLFAGINTGWETQIPDYSESGFDSLLDFERAQYGMHALHNLGYTEESLEKEARKNFTSVKDYTKQLLYGVIHDYIEFTCKLFYDAGIEKHKIISHIVSISSYTEYYTTEHPPTWVCINDYCLPGWTMSPKTCPYDLDTLYMQLGQNGRNEYANAEGYAHYDNEETCREYFKESLLGNAKLITVYGYDQETGAYGYVKSPDFYFVKVTREWLNYELGADYKWSERPDIVSEYGGWEPLVKLKIKFKDLFE